VNGQGEAEVRARGWQVTERSVSPPEAGVSSRLLKCRPGRGCDGKRVGVMSDGDLVLGKSMRRFAKPVEHPRFRVLLADVTQCFEG
jgi:hypothetical protein